MKPFENFKTMSFLWDKNQQSKAKVSPQEYLVIIFYFFKNQTKHFRFEEH